MAASILPDALKKLVKKFGLWAFPKNGTVNPYAATVVATTGGLEVDVEALLSRPGCGGSVFNDGTEDVTITIDHGTGSYNANFNAVCVAGEGYDLGEARPIFISKITLTTASGTSSCRVLAL